MTWAKAIRAPKPKTKPATIPRPQIKTADVDWARLVTVDFETYWGTGYTLSSMSTSEYVRDPRFKAQMVGIKIGNKPTKIYPPKQLKRALQAINWSTHSLLCHNCVPGDTEVLTRAGWKQIKDVPQATEIMQWDPKTQALSWCTPLAKVKNKASELLSWTTSFHRGQYTAGHRMYFQTPDKDGWQVDTAENVAKRSMNNTYIPLSGYYAGSATGALTEGEARLMEAIRADGSWRITDGAFYGVQFNIRKDRKLTRLQELCADIGVELSEPDSRGRMHIRRTQAPILTRLFELLGVNKTYDRWLIEQPLAIRQAILEELLFWDGHETDKKGFQWSTASYTTATTIETVAHISGWRVSGRWRDNARGFNANNPGAALFVATVTQTSRAKLVSKPAAKKHSGDVYCFTVPTGAFLMRAGGRICVTGNCAFDGFIVSHHYGITPAKYYDTLSMARGLHSNEIGASLDDVAGYYGKGSKIADVLESTKDVLDWPKPLYDAAALYCAQDVDLTYEIFKEMHAVLPEEEMELIHMTIRMFCAPVLRVDIPRVEAEYAREIQARKDALLSVIDVRKYDDKTTLKKTAERALEGEERDLLIAKRVFGSNEKFLDLLLNVGVPEHFIPKKVSPAYIKKSREEKEQTAEEDKYTYAFAKDDLDFTNLPDRVWELRPDFDPEDPGHVLKAAVMSNELQSLVDARIATKSTTNITRAERFLKAGADGMPLPVGYSYYRAHTGRFGGNNKMNMQNLTRGGELRLSILAAPGHQMCVADSAQIEARVNAWLWDELSLLDAFRRGADIYSEFATDSIYGRTITKADKTERHVGKASVLGLGYQMGAAKFQMTLAKGALGGPKVNFSLQQTQIIVNAYRRKYAGIAGGWKKCAQIIEEMAAGIDGSYKCLTWGNDDGIGFIELPNGMRLKYPDLRKSLGDGGWEEWSYQSGPMRKKIYGGLLTENLVQALARIIVMWQMLQIDKKYPIVMTTHDECVAHPKTREAQRCYDLMIKWMSTPPWWCLDIPLSAEGGVASNYSK